MDMKTLDAAARAVQLPKVAMSASHNSRLSLNIVNSKRNGKRIKLSKGLALAAGITESAAMLPIKSEGLLMVAEKLPYPAAHPVNLKDDEGAKIAYNYGMVALLTEVFDLDFSERTSMSFSDITIETLEDDTPVALIRISNGQAEEGTPSLEKQ